MTSPIAPDVYESAAIQVFKDVSLRINERLDSWDFALGNKTIEKLLQLLRANRDDLGDISFVFELQQTEHPAGANLTAKSLVNTASAKPTIVVLDRELRVIKTRPLELKANISRVVTLCALSANIALAEYESRSVVNFYANRSVVACESLDSLGSAPPTKSKFARRGDDYEFAVRDHYREQVKYWQMTDHWHNRQKRILRKSLGSRKTTESIFHHSLFFWLNQNLDAHVRREPKTVESDEPDIEIASFSGKFFVIEVKWLGSAGGSPYLRPRLVKAIGQVNTYLKKQKDVNKATLVVYDARKREEFEALTDREPLEDGCLHLERCDRTRLLARGTCLVLFLENKTASE